MLIKMLTSLSGNGVEILYGDVVDRPTEIAEAWIEGGLAQRLPTDEEAKASLESLMQVNKDLVQRIEVLQAEHDAKSSELIAANEEILKLRAAGVESAELTARIAALEADLEKTRVALSEAQGALESVGGLQGELATARDEIAALKQAAIDGGGDAAKVAELTASLETANAALAETQKQLATVQQTLDVQSATVQGLTADKDAATAAASELQSKFDAQGATLATVTEERDALAADLEKVQTELDKTAADLAEQTKLRQAAFDERDAMKAQADAAAAKLNELQAALDAATKG